MQGGTDHAGNGRQMSVLGAKTRKHSFTQLSGWMWVLRPPMKHEHVRVSNTAATAVRWHCCFNAIHGHVQYGHQTRVPRSQWMVSPLSNLMNVED